MLRNTYAMKCYLRMLPVFVTRGCVSATIQQSLSATIIVSILLFWRASMTQRRPHSCNSSSVTLLLTAQQQDSDRASYIKSLIVFLQI